MANIEVSAFCGGPFQTNGYLFKTGEEAWLFDAPEDVAGWVAEYGAELKGLVLTHQHHDHVIGAGEVVEKFGCPVWAFSEPSEDLTLAKRLEQMMGMPCPLDDYPVDHLLEGEEMLVLGSLNFDVLHVPGHSPDSLCFRLADQPLLVGGDVLFAGSIGRTDFPHSDHDALITGIREKLWPLPDETRVLPGHGPSTTIGEERATNPFLQ